jgi:hypothetical protein
MRFPPAGRLAKRLLLVVLAGLCLFLVSALIFALECSGAPAEFTPTTESSRHVPQTEDIRDYTRPEEDTFLTYPEWFIVWSYQEKADFQQKHLPAAFPYFGSIAQYWHGYCHVNAIVRGRYPFNMGDHLMLVVIGSSFSVEYLLKGIYERTVGRATEWISGNQAVEEDTYAYRVAREYADFVHIRPFYEFSFSRSLSRLWKSTSLWGPHPIRKWERKAWLSLDYGIEAIYCGLIEKSSHAVYGEESAETYVWIDNAADSAFAENPRIRKVKQIGPQAFIAVIPRYQEFTDTAERLARQGVRFVQIAGNGQVLLTVIVPRDMNATPPATELLFSSQMLTEPTSKRMALRTPVSSLHAVLKDLRERGLAIEHVYDY